MLYDVVFKNGKEIRCYSKSINDVLKMFLNDDIGVFIVSENDYPEKNTYIKPSNVSHIRFNKKDDYKTEPI